MQAPAPQLILLCGTPHLDWDWELPFPILCDNNPAEQIGYFNPSYPSADAFSIFEAAIQLAQGNPNTYVYSICEMGFLRAFVDANPEKVAQLLSSFKTLEILGGGITSPDNLLPHGEAFIRNYLIGNTWLKNTLGLTTRQAWIPDDFGHDSQLPVLLAAMGFQGVAFMRIPGFYDNLAPLDGSPSVYQQLAQNGVDFIWSARDGSTVIAHWLQYGYYQGSGLNPQNAIANIQNYISQNEVSSPTVNLFVAVGNDFAMPTNIPGCVTAWNGQSPAPAVKAQAGTFDDFVQLLAQSNLLQTHAFYPQPFYTGCFQTRPLLKKLHYRAARALLGAEIFNTIAGFQFFAPHNARTQQPDPRSWEIEIQGRAAVLRKGWDDLAPSTHHDYITGTGIHYVYYGEQVTRLEQVSAGAEAVRAQAMREIAAQINSQAQSGELPVAVFNQLGFLRDGMVELVPTPELVGNTFQSVSFDGDTYSVQPTYEGRWLFPASVGSLGYATSYLSSAAITVTPEVSIAPKGAASSYQLTNEFMQVGVSAASNWGIDYILDLKAPNEGANVLGQASNQLTLYTDSNGNNYRYSNENESTLTPAKVEFTSVSAQVLETGPLRVRLLTRIQCTVNQIPYTYTLEYILVAGEPFLRMRTTGACPFGYSLMTQFTMAQNIGTMARGTTYHWDDTPLVRYWTGPSMQAAHDFAILENATGAPLGAIYHVDMPAWGQVDTGATIAGGLMRNPGLNYFSGVGGQDGPIAAPPMGIDPDVHTLEYAFRVPTGITLNNGVTDASTGAQLIEALGYNTPFVAFAVPAATSRKLPEGFVLASVSNASGASQPIITAAKPAEADPNNLILRVYQPSNTSMNAVLSLAGLQSLNGQQTLTVTPVTALEQSISGATPLATTPGGYALTASAALTTLLVTQAE